VVEDLREWTVGGKRGGVENEVEDVEGGFVEVFAGMGDWEEKEEEEEGQEGRAHCSAEDYEGNVVF